MTRYLRSGSPRLAVLVVLAAGLLVSACGGARQIREAQDRFDEGARLENLATANRLGFTRAAETVPAVGSPRDQYLLALEAVTTEIKQNRDELRKEKLLGHAYMLQAKSLWRLAYYESDAYDFGTPDTCRAAHPRIVEMQKVLATVRAELGRSPPIILGTRDRVMTVALLGLKDHDKGLFAPSYAAAAACFKASYALLDDAVAPQSKTAPGMRGPLPASHPVRLFIRLAQLQTLNAWRARIYRSASDRTARNELMNAEIRPRLRKSYCAIATLEKQGIQNARAAADPFVQAIGLGTPKCA